jgi:hypothetical protein
VPLDVNGIWQYEESDDEATASALLNLAQAATSTRIGELDAALLTKAPEVILTPFTPLQLHPNFNITNGPDGEAVRYKTWGRMTEIVGTIYPATAAIATAISSGAAQQVTANAMPVEARPQGTREFVCPGSGNERYSLIVTNTGFLHIHRYGPAVATTTSRLKFSVNWIN